MAKARGFGRKLLWVSGATLTLLAVSYWSLLVTSAPLSLNERLTIARVIPILEDAGFQKEAFVLRHLATYRDNTSSVPGLFECGPEARSDCAP